MSDENHHDDNLAAHFAHEHRHIAADDFVAATMRKVRAARRSDEFLRVGVRLGVLSGAVIASPWLIAGVARLNSGLESFSTRALGVPGTWVLGAIAILALLALRVRSR